MGLLDRIEGKSAEPVKTSLDLFREVYGGWRVHSGQAVSWKTALQVSTVLACARVLAEGIAQVPLKILQESEDGRVRTPAKDHELYHLLHRRPNFYQTSFEYRETMGLHLALCGRHISFKNRSPLDGRIMSLIPFEPQHVTVKRDKQTLELTYEVRPEEGEPLTFPAEAIWDVRGPSWTSYTALEPWKLAREAIGLAMATEEHHAKLHKNGARVGGLISVENTMTDQQYQQMRKWVDKYFEGTANEHAGRTMILDRGAKFAAAQQTGVESQHLDTRRYQVEEICRHMRVMPIMVGYSDKASTYASAEQMFLAHLVHTLSPWYERIEQSIDVNLLSEKEQKAGLYAKFITQGMLRGAMKDTAEYLARMTLSGIMVRNEARAVLDMNAIDGLDEPLTPVNTFVGTEPPKKDGDGGKGSEEDDDGGEGEDGKKRRTLAAPAPQVTFAAGAIQVDARTTIQDGAVQVDARSAPKVEAFISSPGVTVQHPKSSTQHVERDGKTQEVTRIRTEYEHG